MQNEIIETEYTTWISDLKKRYQQSQIKAAVKVNSELLKFYWSLGKDIVSKKAESKWGSSFYKTLSSDLTKAIPNVKGLSERNLRYMGQMFELFSNSATTCGKNEDEVLSISEYELQKLYPVDFKSSLPSIAEIESELEKSDGLDK